MQVTGKSEQRDTASDHGGSRAAAGELRQVGQLGQQLEDLAGRLAWVVTGQRPDPGGQASTGQIRRSRQIRRGRIDLLWGGNLAGHGLSLVSGMTVLGTVPGFVADDPEVAEPWVRGWTKAGQRALCYR
jgi:hypothetical protein